MKKVPVIAGIVTALLISCVNDYNPFENKDNIDVKIEQTKSSIRLNDTCSVFSTESLSVYATVWEQIDSFVVATDSNRLWLTESKKTVRPGPQNYTFYFSWNDTGNHPVDIRIFRADGKSYSKRVNVLVRSPLFQDSIVCEAGAVCTLYTPGTFDAGLSYHWYFGDFYGQRVEPYYLKPGRWPVEILIGQQKGKGSLWIEDSSGKRSPSVYFSYKFTDNKPPEIIINSAQVNGDTVITGDSLFILNYYIRDNGGIKTVSINDSLDYKRDATVNGELVTRVLTNMHTATRSRPHVDTVIAIDAAGLKTTRIVYTVFNVNGPRTNAVVLQIVSPAAETWKTIDSSMSIVYKLFNYSTDTVYVKAARGTVSKVPDAVMPGSDTTLFWDCPLSAGANTIRINAYRSDTIASKYIVIERASDLVDTIHPQISHVLVNGQEGIRHSATTDKIELSFLAFDNSGTLKTITINGKNASPVPGKKFQYLDTLQVEHLGSTFIIRAVDNVGLFTEDTVFVRSNTAPVFTKEALSGRFIIGETKNDTIAFMDSDGDSVTVSFTIVPQNPVVASCFSLKKSNRNEAILLWNGTGSPAVGQYVMRITLWDGYQAVTTERTFYVTIPGSIDIPAFESIRTISSATDTLSDGTIDLRKAKLPVRIGINIVSALQTLTKKDSVIVENAESVLYYNELGQLAITLGKGRGRVYDTVNVLVRSVDGHIDTADRIAVLYPPREPTLVSSLNYWFALDRGAGKDYDIREGNLIDWWYNRVDQKKQLYAYSSGNEPIISSMKTPGGKPSLDFSSRATVLINYPDGMLDIGGNWPKTDFTAFFVAKRNPVISDGGILLSSSDYDSVYFAIGVSKSGKLAAFNNTDACSTVTIIESNAVLDTSWNIIVYRSAGRSLQNDSCTIQMTTKMPLCNSVRIPTTGVSGNLMVGSANKHIGRISWPGQIAETALYQRKLTDSECQEVILYLAGKHGIYR
jgi:hypothetical protein